MAAGKDQAEAVVGNFIGLEAGIWIRGHKPGRNFLVQRFFETSATSDAVDGFVPGGLNNPSARIIGHSDGAPMRESGGESILHRVFGKLEVADQANHRGDDPAPIGTVESLDGRVGAGEHVRL